MADEKEFMEDQLLVAGVPKPAWPSQTRVGVWVGVVVGVVVGIVMRTRDLAYSPREVMYVRLLGDLWISGMRALALPLFLSTLIVSAYDLSLVTTLHVFWQMIVIVVLFRTWLGVQTAVVAAMSNAGSVTRTERSSAMADLVVTPNRHTSGDAVLDVFRNIFADNPVEALVRTGRTSLLPPWDADHGTGDLYAYKSGPTAYLYQANLLGLTLSGLAVGVATVLLRKEVQSLVLLTRVVADACATVMMWLLVTAAPFVALCFAADIAGSHEFKQQYDRMWQYLTTMGVQLVIQLIVVYPLILAVTAARRSKRPIAGYYLLWFTSEALVVAYISRSAHVAYPLMLRCIQHIQGIDKKATTLAFTLLSVWLADGSAIYLATASTWVAQDQNQKLIKINDGYIITGVMSAVGSVSSAGEAQAHPALTVMLAATLGAQTRSVDLAPIMLWDWLMGAIAAVVNVSGAFFMALVLGYYSNRRKLKKLDQDKAVNDPPPPPPALTVENAWLYSGKPLDTAVYPPIQDDPELDEIRAKCQVRKEKRRAKRAEKDAAQGQHDAERAKERKAEAEKAADEAEKRREEAEAAADKAEETASA